MVFKSKYPVKTKIVTNNSTFEKVSRFKHFGCAVSYESEYDVKEKINKYKMCIRDRPNIIIQSTAKCNSLI